MHGAHPLNEINPLNAELNPICYLLALLGAHHFLHVSRIRVKCKWENKTRNVELMLEKKQYRQVYVIDRSKDNCVRLNKYNSMSGTRTAESLT